MMNAYEHTTLRVTNVTCSRGSVVINEAVSFTLKSGDFLLLKGANGCGKTTLLRLLAGLQHPYKGQIDIPDDQAVYLGHFNAVKPALSVEENLKFWADIYEGNGVTQALGRFNLTDLAAYPAGRLSSGQKRRLSLARLLLVHCPIWLLDEPTISLDDKSVDLLRDVLKAHLKAGGICVAASHIDIGIAGQILDMSAYKVNKAMPSGFLGEVVQ